MVLILICENFWTPGVFLSERTEKNLRSLRGFIFGNFLKESWEILIIFLFLKRSSCFVLHEI